MPKPDAPRTQWVNVVVTAKSNNPSLLNPDFLRINKITPPDWEVDQTLTTPAISFVKYKNRINVQVTDERLEIREEFNGNYPEKSFAYDISAKYTQTLPHVSYMAAGLNWGLISSCAEADHWLVNRFLTKERWLVAEPVPKSCRVIMAVAHGEATCNFDFSPVAPQGGAENPEAIGISCNVHFRGPLDPAAVSRIVSEAAAVQEFVRGQVDRFLFG